MAQRRGLKAGWSIDRKIEKSPGVQWDLRKKSHQKEVKTKDAASVAIKQAEKTAARDYEKLKQTQIRSVQRKIFWFEKFIWFITSENYLVIGGRNAQ